MKWVTILTTVLFANISLANSEVAQMACQQQGFDGVVSRVLVLTQAEQNSGFTNAVAPVSVEKNDFKEVLFKIQIFPGKIDLNGDVEGQVRELMSVVKPEPEFDFETIGRKDDNWLGFHEVNDQRDFLIRVNLEPDFPNVSYIRPGKESFTYRCKRFYKTTTGDINIKSAEKQAEVHAQYDGEKPLAINVHQEAQYNGNDEYYGDDGAQDAWN